MHVAHPTMMISVCPDRLNLFYFLIHTRVPDLARTEPVECAAEGPGFALLLLLLLMLLLMLLLVLLFEYADASVDV